MSLKVDTEKSQSRPSIPSLNRYTAIERMVQKARQAKGKTLDQEIELQSNIGSLNMLADNASSLTSRVDKELDLAHFKSLLSIFKNASKNGSGMIDLEEFKAAFAHILGSKDQLQTLFNKIDVDSRNRITWDEFSEFMLTRSEGQKNMREEDETQLFVSDQGGHSGPIQTPHRDMIIQIRYNPTTKRFISVSRDGTVCYWNDHFRMQRCYKNIGFKANPKGVANSQLTAKQLYQQRWTQDFVSMDNVYSFAMATDDHQICVYDLSTMGKTHVFNLKDTCALSMDYYTDSSNPDVDFNRLVYGTDSGYIYVHDFPSQLFVDRAIRKKGSYLEFNMDHVHVKPPPHFGRLVKRKVHNDWTIKIRYYHNMKCVISCSMDPKYSIVVSTEHGDGHWTTSFGSVQKGVKCFALSTFPFALVTGGTDRQIRIWNPRKMSLTPIAIQGHNSPIYDVKINSLNGQIISLSEDKVIRIFDLRSQQALQTIMDPIEQRPEDFISCIKFTPENGGHLITASSILQIYSLKERATLNGTKTHEFPIRTLLYSSTFNQIVSGCTGGVANVWDAFNGSKIFRFSGLHGDSELTAMTFDSKFRRLFTGGRDGTLKAWNFNNGQLLQELENETTTEITSIVFVDLHDTQYIAVAGWNRRLTVYLDEPDQLVLHPCTILPLEDQVDAWHKDDILSMAFCAPNFIATSSYDGIVILTNIHSATIVHVINPAEYEPEKPLLRSIDKVLFLDKRIQYKKGAALITAGSDGFLRFWNVHQGTLVWKVDGTNGRSECIYCMTTNSTNDLLITADAAGWVSLWDISQFCINESVPDNDFGPYFEFRAHASPILGLTYMESTQTVVTSSSDCTVRLNSMDGSHIGILGQSSTWDLRDPASLTFADAPKDVLAILKQEEEEAEAEKRLSSLKNSSQVSGTANKSEVRNSRQQKNGAGHRSSVLDLSGSLAAGELSTHSRERLQTADAMKPGISTWYCSTQYAKAYIQERMKPKKIPLGAQAITKATREKPAGSLRLFQYLEPYELETIRLPPLKGGKVDLNNLPKLSKEV